MTILDSVIVELIILGTTFLMVLIAYYKWTYQYWNRRGLPYLEPTIPSGSMAGPLAAKENLAVQVKQLYDVMKLKGWRHGGLFLFLSPVYLVLDLDYVKNILAKDFQYFIDCGVYYNEEDDPISAHLFNIGGTKWRNLRTKLTLTFTSGKMKMMFQTLIECEAGLQQKILKVSEKGTPIDIKEILACFTTDVIGSCAFGLDCKTFEAESSPFREFGSKVFERSPLRRLKTQLAGNFPNFSRRLHIKGHRSDVSNFFMKIVKDTVDYREKNQITRNDFMQLLIDMKNNKFAEEDGYKHDGRSLTIEEIAAQSFAFFIAGFETSSTTMAFALYELSRNQQIQEKVRQEIKHVLAKHGGQITYDSVQEMKYINQVIDETLRMYPPGAILQRKCMKDYKIPDSDITIEEGTLVLIPILGIHHDKEYYPDPEKFDPERFTEENKNSRHSYAHIPFGEGPRICIGMRFGLLQTKVGLISLLRNFKFTGNKKTQEPLQFKPNAVVLAVVGEIWLNAEKLAD